MSWCLASGTKPATFGADTGAPVEDQDYQVPFAVTGRLNKLTVKMDRRQLSPADIKQLEQAQRRKRFH